MTKVNYNKSSPYYSTPQVNKYLDYLDFWNGTYILPTAKDTLITLDSKYNKRPDLLSYDLYGNPHLWWVFMLRNPDVIKDPIYDFLTGIVIYTPDQESMRRFS